MMFRLTNQALSLKKKTDNHKYMINTVIVASSLNLVLLIIGYD